MTRSDVYRTKQGRTLRISVAEDGAIRVELLEGAAWVAGSVRMAGLRLSPTTRKLTAREVLALQLRRDPGISLIRCRNRRPILKPVFRGLGRMRWDGWSRGPIGAGGSREPQGESEKGSRDSLVNITCLIRLSHNTARKPPVDALCPSRLGN